jgi:predicted  nucleic acid-binding Zn-ribbon protein
MKQAITTIAFVALAACAAVAIAQPKMTKDGKRIGTREEYAACLNTADDIEQRQNALRTRSETIAKEMKALNDESPELNAAVKSADDDGLTGIRRTRLERRVKEHDSRLKAAQEQEAALNKDVDGFNKFVEDYKGKCTGIAFDNDDIDAVKKERAAAGKK